MASKLYNAFVDAGFKIDADRLYSFTDGTSRQELGSHIARFESGEDATSQETLLSSAQGICKFIEEKRIPMEKSTGHVLDEVENFINKYSTQTTN